MATRYIALLRGINVGGNNIIPMAALRGAFEEMGFSAHDVDRKRQRPLHGAVVQPTKLTTRIEAALVERKGTYPSPWALVTPAPVASLAVPAKGVEPAVPSTQISSAAASPAALDDTTT